MSKGLVFLFLVLSISVFGQKLLDPGELTATSTAAYSVRQLKTTYSHSAITPPTAVIGFTNSTTPLIRVRRSSDNGQLDIGYLSSGDLDTVTLKSFVGSGNGFVSVWYDQSGNSRDVSQATAANQPRIVNSGTVERSTNGKIGIRFVRDGGNTYAGSNQLTRTISASDLFSGGITGTALSVFEASSGNSSAWGYGNGDNRWQIHANEGGGLKFDYGGSVGTWRRTSIENTANQGVLKNYAFIAPSTGGGQIWVNGILVSTGDAPTSPCTETLFQIGGIASFNNWNFDNRQSELILFNSELSTTDRTKATDDQGVNFLDLFIWSGAVSTDYANAANWRNNSLPTVTSDIYVPVIATNPMTVSNIYQVRNVTVESGTTITIGSGGNLQVSGDINYGGSFTGAGTLTLNGTTSQNLLGINGVYGNLTINNAAGVLLPVTASINGTLTFVNGKLDIGNTTSNPVVINTVTLNGAVVGSNATNSFRGSNQTDLVWGTGASGTIVFDGAANSIRNLTLNSTNPMVLGANISVNGGDLTINSGAALDLQTFTANRSAAGGTLTVAGTLFLGGASNFPANFNTRTMTGGTVNYNGLDGVSQTISTLPTYNNLTLSNGSGTGDAPKVSAGNFTVNGTFTIDTLTTFTPAAANVISGSGGVLTGKGTIVANRITATTDFNTQYNFTTRTLNSLTVNYAGAGAQTVNNTNTYGNVIISGSGIKTLGGATTINGNLTISAGTLDVSGSNFALNIGGNFTNDATFNDRAGTVTFNGTNQQIAGATATEFHILTISSGTTTLTRNITIANVSGAGITIATGAILNLSTFTCNRAGTTGTRVLTINGTLQLGASTGGQTGSNYPTNFTAPPTMGTNGVVEYNGTSDIVQTVFATTYRNLTLTNGTGSGSAVKNASANFTVSSTFTINDGAVFSPNTTGLVFTGTGATLTGTGAFIRRAARATQYPGFTFNIPPLVEIDGTVTSIGAGTYDNIYISVNTSLTGAVVVTGDLTIISGTLTTGGNNISVGGNWTNNGTYTGGTSVVTFNGSSKQTIAGSTSTTFSSLTNSNVTDTLVVNTNITISSGGTLNLNGASTIIQPATGVVITGTGANITGSGTVRVTRTAATANYASQYSFGTHTLTNLTIDYCADAAQTVTINGAGVNYGNLVISGNGTKTLSNNSITTTNVTGNIIVRNGATLSDGGNNISITGNASRTFQLDSGATLLMTRMVNFPTGFGTFTIDNNSTVNFGRAGTQNIAARQYGNLIISGSNTKTPAAGTHTINGNFLLSAGTYAANTNNPNLNFGGNFTNSATFTTGTGTITFNGSTQTITGATTFSNLTISSSVSTTLANNVTIQDVTGGNLTISSGSILDLAGNTCNRAGTTNGTRTLNISGTLRLSGTNNFPTNFATPTGSGTVEYYNPTGGQTITATTYQNLTLSNTSGTQTAGAAVTVNGTLTMSGGTFNMSTFALSGSSLTTSGTGTIQTQNTSSTPLPAGRTWTQDIVYNSSSAQTIVNGNYQNLNASGGNRTLQNSGTIGIAGTFTAGTGTYTVTGSTVDFNGSGLQTIPAMSFNNLSVSGTKVGSPSLTLFPGTINIAGNFTNTSTGLGTIFTSGSKVDYNGATQNVAALTYGKLSISGTGLKTLTGNTVVNDSITIGGTTGLDGGSFILSVLGPWINNAAYTGSTGTVVFEGYSSQTLSGTVTPSFNALTINNTSNVSLERSVTVSGTLTFTTGKLLLNGQTLTIGGAITNTVSGGIRGSSASNIVVNNNTARTISMDQTTPGTTNLLNNLTLNNTSGTITCANNIAVNGTLTTTAGGILDLGTNTLSGTLSSVSNSGTISTSNTSGTPLPTGKTWGGTVTYAATTGGQTIVSATSYNNLTLSNTSGTQTSSGNLVVNGTLTTTAGGTLSLGTNTLSGTLSSVSNSGTISTSNTTGTPLPTGKTWGGTVTYAATTGGQTIVSATSYNNLTLSNTSGIQTSSGNLVVNGTLTTTAGGTLSLGNNTLSGTLITVTNNGTISTTNTTGTPLPTGKTWGGTVTYSATTGGQTIVSATSYNNLSLSNTSGIQTSSGNLVVNGTLTTTAGGTLSLGTNTLSGTLSTVTNNGTISTTNTTGTPLPTGKTWGGTVTYAATTGGQTIVSATSYNNLTLSNTSGIQTSSGNLVVNGTLTTTAGGTLSLGTNTLSGTLSTVTNNGTISTTNTSGTPLPTGKTWGGTVTYAATTGGQTVVSATSYTVLTLANTSGTQTAGGGITVTTLNNTNTSSTLNMGANALTATTINNNGTIRTQNTTASPIPTGLTIGGTVTYDASGAQTIVVNTYNDVSLAGSGNKSLNGNTTVNNITVGGSSVLLAGSNTLTVLGNWVNNSTLTPNTSSVSFSGSVSQTMSGSVEPIFNNLTINNASGVVMNAPITVGGLLNISNGKLSVGSNTLTLNGTISSSVSNSLTSNGSSNITIGSSGGNGTLFFDQTIPGTSNKFATVTINRSGNTITLGNNMEVGTALNLTAGKLAIGNNTLTISGTLSSSSVNCLVGNGSSSLSITGSGSLGSNIFMDQTTPGTTNRLSNLSYNRSSQTLTLGNAVEVTGVLTPTAGTLAASGNLTLVSNGSGTARIANGGCSSCSYITGNVSVQRNIPAVARRWRFLGSTVQSSTLADWKNETYITGVGGVSNGFDATGSNAASVYSYNESALGAVSVGWVAATNITNSLTPGKGYRVFIRGDRSDPARLTGFNATQNEVTLDLVGTPNQGDISAPVTRTNSGSGNSYVQANDGWNLVSNPYPSPYDWNAHYDNGSFHANLDPMIWVLSSSGGYLDYNASSNSGSLTGGLIPSGASFWVKANNGGTPSLTFKEQFKVGGTPASLFKTSEGESFGIKLIADSVTWDITNIKYMAGSTPNLDLYDIPKLAGTITVSAWGNDSQQLSLSVRPLSVTVDTIRLNVSASAGTYTLSFINSSELSVADNVLLYDTYLSTITDLKQTSSYVFSITSSSQSQGMNRFYIVVGNTNALPVKLLQFTAAKTDEGKVLLKWATVQEDNSKDFVVERSADGRIYSALGIQPSAGSSRQLRQYEYVDEYPGIENYYRLKQVDLDGSVSYSGVAYVSFEAGYESTELEIYPVPTQRILHVSHVRNMAEVSVKDISGRELLRGLCDGTQATIEVGSLEVGIYIVEVLDTNGIVLRQKFIKD